jgi:FkbM family methyltransferase
MRQQLRLTLQSLKGILTKQILGKYVNALLVKSINGLFAVDPEDYGVGWELRKNGRYGAAEIDKLKRYIDQNSRVLIVGAHIGTLAIPISKLCNEVVAIEANPITYNLLKINISLNDLPNCHAINVAASDKEEDIEFLLSRANSGGSKRVPRVKKYMYYYDNPEKIIVHAVSLDEYLEDKNFDVVIMDIEGSEYFALKGMTTILGSSKVLVVEFLPHHLKNVAGVTVEQFLSILPPYQTLTIPSRELQVYSTQFLSILSDMYDRELGDEGIIFERA